MRTLTALSLPDLAAPFGTATRPCISPSAAQVGALDDLEAVHRQSEATIPRITLTTRAQLPCEDRPRPLPRPRWSITAR